MTALTLRVIWKDPPVTLHEICNIFPKFQKHLLYMATSTLPQILQEAAVTICSEKFQCPSHVQRTWGGLFKNRWGGGSIIQCMGKYGERDSLEKGKYVANSCTAARVNLYYNCYFGSGTEILMAVCSSWIFFQELFLERELHISINRRFIFSGDSFLGGNSTPLGLHLL